MGCKWDMKMEEKKMEVRVLVGDGVLVCEEGEMGLFFF